MKKKKVVKRNQDNGLYFVVSSDGCLVAEDVNSLSEAMKYAENHVIMYSDKPAYILKAVKEVTIDIKVKDMT